MLRSWKYFKCEQCGKCCEELGLPYDPDRLKEMADYLRVSVNQLIETYYGKYINNDKQIELDDNKRQPCPFIRSDKDSKICTIYSVRPQGCKLYPLETDFGRGGVDCRAAQIVFNKLREEDKCYEN